MGVDIWISQKSFRANAIASCHQFHLYPRIEIGGRRTKRIHRFHVITALAAYEEPIRGFSNHSPIDPAQVTPEQFAIEVVAILLEKSNRSRKYLIRWLSEKEYEAILEKHYPNWVTQWRRVPYVERMKICHSCPARPPDYDDCRPRLFSYGTLPVLRKAATELFGSPPATFRIGIKQLVMDFLLLFPDSVSSNAASEAANRTRMISEQLKQEGYTLLQPNDVTPTPDHYEQIAEAVINGLFFPAMSGVGEGPQEWLDGDRLIRLENWINRLLALLMEWNSVQLLSDEMQQFASVLLTYRTAARNAVKFNFSMSVSY